MVRGGVIKSEHNLIRAEIRQEHNLAVIKERSTTLHQQSTLQRARAVMGPSVSAASHPRETHLGIYAIGSSGVG
jgi:hypothetical protein